MDVRIYPGPLSGTVHIPVSKSYGHRLLIAAYLSSGKYPIDFPLSEDLKTTLRALEDFGGKLSLDKPMFFQGKGAPPEGGRIRCGVSGSTLRFLLPLAGVSGEPTEFILDPELERRPLEEYFRILSPKGAELSRKTGKVILHGKLHPGYYHLSGEKSTQFLTGLLMALPLLNGESEIIVDRISSEGYVAITLDVLKQSGIKVYRNKNHFMIPGGQQYDLPRIDIPGDDSQGAFYLTAAALGHDIKILGLEKNSLQSDVLVRPTLEKMGFDFHWNLDGVSLSGKLHGIQASGDAFPDGVLPLIVLSAFAGGESRWTDLERLRYKECDRLYALEQGLRALGQQVRVENNVLYLSGGGLTGGSVNTFGDHRMVMSFAIAGTKAQDPIQLNRAESVAKSYPDFWKDFKALGGMAEKL